MSQVQCSPEPRKMRKTESPIVQKTFQRRRHNNKAKKALFGIFVNLIGAIFMYSQLIYGSQLLLDLSNIICWYIVCVLALVFTLNIVTHVISYIRCVSYGAVHVNTNQRQLLGVSHNDSGFRTLLPESTSPLVGRQSGNDSSQMSQPGIIDLRSRSSTSLERTSSLALRSETLHSLTSGYSGHPTPSATQLAGGSPYTTTPHSIMYSHDASPLVIRRSSKSITPPQMLNISPGVTPSSSFIQSQPSAVSQITSPSYLSANNSQSFNNTMSMNNSIVNNSLLSNPSPGSGILSDTMGLRSRFHNTSYKGSPGQSDGHIKDMKELDQYLREQDSKERREQQALDSSTAGNTSGSSSFWSFNRGAVSDFSPLMRKYSYQIACRSPQSTKAKTDESDDGPAHYEASEVWTRSGILMGEVDSWVENLRKWLGITIFSRLNREIVKLNKELVTIGCEDMEIGEVSVSTLKQLAVTKSQYVPTLSSLIPYLEVSVNQEYAVHRILELGSSGCISDFCWNSGGRYKGKSWASHLPTDAAILMHCLCTYMDSHLPPHPKYPDGKTFSTPHFIKTPDKPNLERKDNLCIYQTNLNPPHFKVVIGDDIWNIPKGRNNVFQAILLFLHHIKTKQHGMLGKVNLGFSGINILWILES